MAAGLEAAAGAEDERDGQSASPVAVELETVDALINLALAPYASRERERPNSTHGAYHRSLLAFRRWLTEGHANLSAGLEACIDGYLAALASGAWRAPKSAYGIAENHPRPPPPGRGRLQTDHLTA